MATFRVVTEENKIVDIPLFTYKEISSISGTINNVNAITDNNMDYMKKKFVDKEDKFISFFSTDDNIICSNGKTLRDNIEMINNSSEEICDINYISPESLDEFIELTKEGGLFYLLTNIPIVYNEKNYDVIGLLDVRPHSNGINYFVYNKMWQFLIDPNTKEFTRFSSFSEFLQSKIPSDASELSIKDENNNFTSENVEGALSELFQFVSNGKKIVANAITDKGINTLATDTFQTMANNISQIVTGTNIDGTTITINNVKYKLSRDTEGNIVATKVKYTITNNLTNATNSNAKTEIEDGNSYNATITLDSNYELYSILITMDGEDITATCYNNKIININKVTGNIVITVVAREVQQPGVMPLSDVVFDMKDYSADDSDIYADENDKYYIHDIINNEEIKIFQGQKMLIPFKNFTSETSTTYTATSVYNKMIENINNGKDCTLIYVTKNTKEQFQSEKLSGKIRLSNSYDSSLYGWNTWKGDCVLPYINSSDERITPESQIKSVNIAEYTIPSITGDWGRRIFTFNFKSNGICKLYFDNVLLFTFDAPSDFKKWDFTFIQDAFNYGILTYILPSSFAAGCSAFEYIITNDSIDSNKLTTLYEYLVSKDISTDIASEDAIYMQKGDSYETYSEVLPSYIKDSVNYSIANNNIATIDNNGIITSVEEGNTVLTRSTDDVSKKTTVYVGKQVSDDCSITNDRTITDILLVDTPDSIEIGEEYPIYAIGINENENLPYTVSSSNLLNFSSNNPSVCSVQYGVLKANSIGNATITVSNLDNTVTKTFDVTVTEVYEPIILDEEILNVDNASYNISSDGTNSENTTLGIQSVFDYAKDNRYKKIVFTKGIYNVNADYGILTYPSDMIIDFSDSKIIIEYSSKTDEGYTMSILKDCENTILKNVSFYGEDYTQTGGNMSNTSLTVRGNSKNCKFINCHFWYSSGFNVSCHYSRTAIKSGLTLNNIEGGGLTGEGVNDDTDTTNVYRSINYIDISTLGDTFGLGNMQGYQGYRYMSARLYDIYFFDSNKNFISMLKYCVQYQQYNKPSNAYYCKVAFYQDFIPTTADPDFSSIAHFYTATQPTNIKFIDCSFKYNVMTGVSPQGCVRLMFDNCIFEDNGSADPYSHIDWEDGRIHIQGHIIRNCVFKCTDSKKWHCNVAMLNGRDIAFHDNKFIGSGNFYLTSEMQNARIYRNKFLDDVKTSLASKTDMIYCGNVNDINYTIGDVLGGMQIIQDNNIVV